MRQFALLFSYFIALLISGCNRSQLNHQATSNPTTNVLRIGCANKFLPLTPFNYSGSNGLANNLIYDSLLEISPDLTLQPWLASEVVRSADESTWRLKIHPQVRFHDGTVLNAEDAAATLKCAMQSANASGINPLLSPVASIRATNSEELEIKLKLKAASLPIGLVIEVIKSSQIDCGAKQLRTDTPLGTGPYKLESWSPERVVLKRNLHYWVKVPKIETIVFEVFPNKNEAWAALINGNLDLLYDVPAENNSITETLPHLRIINVPMDFFHMIMFDMHDEKLRHPFVRQALNYAIDRQAIVERLFGRPIQLSSGIIPLRLKMTAKQFPPYAYNPKKALQLLAAAGYHPPSLTQIKNHQHFIKLTALGFMGDEESAKLLREIQTYLQEIGIWIEAKMLPVNTILSAIHAKQAGLIHLYSRAYHDPVVLYEGWSGDLRTAFFPYHSQALQGLFQNYFKSPEMSKTAFLDRFQEILYQDPPGIFLYWKESAVALSSRVQGAHFNPGNFLGKIWDWSIKEP